MSLDISVKLDTDIEVINTNVSHNYVDMWKEANIYDILYNSDGKTAKSVFPILEVCLCEMIMHPSRFRKHNPTGGCGNYRLAVKWLSEFTEQLKKYPEGVIEIHK